MGSFEGLMPTKLDLTSLTLKAFLTHVNTTFAAAISKMQGIWLGF